MLGSRGVRVLAAERRQVIAGLIHEQPIVRVEDLCIRFGASASTIRRDLEYLERQGILKRTYGGAVAADRERAVESTREDGILSLKEIKIGSAAAGLIAEGETIFLGSGSLTLSVARHIVKRPGVTVVTNCLNVAAYLASHSQLPVILTGGQVDRREAALVGHVAELALRELRADRAIIGVGGIHIPDGVTGEGLPTVQIMRAVIDMMPEVVIVADSRRWGHVGPVFLAPLEAIDVIVTDLDAPPAMVWDLTELGIKIVQT